MSGARLTAAALALLAASVPALALADDDPAEEHVASVTTETVPRPPSAKAESNIDQRLAFLDQRIATQHLHAQLWWQSWVTFYGVGVIVQSARAAEASENRAEQADLVVSVVKATGGVVRYLVDPNKGIEGFASIAGESPQARLARGEGVLRANAKATTPFGPWYAHLINLALNGTGAVIVGAGFDDWRQGLMSAGIGFVIGEVSLFTQPWEADDDLEEYESRFGKSAPTRRVAEVKWTVVPSAGGAAINASF